MKYAACILSGLVLYLAAEAAAGAGKELTDYALPRNSRGQGESSCSLWVDEEGADGFRVEVMIPEKKLSEAQGEELMEDMTELLCARILGDNESLLEVRKDLELVTELPEYGVTVSWHSEKPEILSSTGLILEEEVPEEGTQVCLEARLSNGVFRQSAVIPVWIYPDRTDAGEELETLIREAAEREPESDLIKLPEQFRGRAVTYRVLPETDSKALLMLGAAGAVCLYLRERQDGEKKRKRREAGLFLDYSEVVSRFMILTGAGFTTRQAWKRMVPEQKTQEWMEEHPVYEEIRMTWNQMETGVSEMQAYEDFGKRCGLRCYTRFASLLQNGLQTGSRNLRKLLEAEMEEAFQQRKDTAKRLGEEASGKLLLPLFLMLGVVMAMITAPAFLTLT